MNFSCSTELYNRLKKKKHNISAASEVLFGANEDCSLGDSTSALRNCSEEAGGGHSIHDFGEGGVYVIKHVFFPEGFY